MMQSELTIPELNILIAAVKADFSGLEKSSVSVDKNMLKQQRLFELAHHHGCVWEVFAYCKFHDLLNEQDFEGARSFAMQSTAHAMHHEQQLVALLQVFEDLGISYALLKGAAIYPQFRTASKQNSRQSADIDLLVNPKEMSRVVEVLHSRGFQCNDSTNPLLIAQFVEQYEHWFRHRDMSFSLSDQSIYVDLHWQVAYSFSLPMITSDLLNRTEQVVIQDQMVTCLSFADHFILLCIHGYLDRFFILKHLADIYWAKNHPRFDFQEIVQLADKYGVAKQVQSACTTVDLFFNQLNQLEQNDQYALSVWHRYEQHEGIPPRMHPGHKEWRLKDKIAYISHQMQSRSRRVGLLAPIIHRFKYDVAMVNEKPKTVSVWLWWPLGYMKRFFRKEP